MTTRIAVIADVHMPGVRCSAQEAALDDALRRLQAERPDLVLVIGDTTACGGVGVAGRIRAKLDGSGLCFRVISGNADRRDLASLDAATDLLTSDEVFRNAECVVCLVDMREGKVTASTKQRLRELTRAEDDLPVMLSCHYPMEDCLHDSDVSSLVASGKVALFIGAHCHRERQYKIENIAAHTIRGLDPDKAIGAPPATAIFELAEHRWRRSEIPFGDGAVDTWSTSMRADFIAQLGFSCMTHSLEGLACASLHGVACVELRATDALRRPRDELVCAVQSWRDGGGRYLSIHMPEPGYDVESRTATDAGAFREEVSLALTLKAEHLTVHVPPVKVGVMQPEGETWAGCVKMFLELLEEPMHSGTVIGIENLHMNPGEAADEARRFGYLPSECQTWVGSLRKASGYNNIGMHLDIGHARNNMPFSHTHTLGQWYALLGDQIVGYHMHQVVMADGVMRNHQPITGMYGPLISFSAFLWGWRRGQLAHAPMFLEIRTEHFSDTVASMQRIRQYVRG